MDVFGFARRRSVDLSLPHDLMEATRPSGVNASQAAEAGIAAAVRRAREEVWLRPTRRPSTRTRLGSTGAACR